ncbi:hypothetical protein L596_028259 [Steinernema carpocapsae]|uniref:Uncharacterized protein n=1 Tax=Steinernema carpocapsae TaxID=34508 RepID=A0A4V5ZXU7_STECR|nr:hypothetical protein L596_028259 [Steinernema carpocapsae]
MISLKSEPRPKEQSGAEAEHPLRVERSLQRRRREMDSRVPAPCARRHCSTRPTNSTILQLYCLLNLHKIPLF